MISMSRASKASISMAVRLWCGMVAHRAVTLQISMLQPLQAACVLSLYGIVDVQEQAGVAAVQGPCLQLACHCYSTQVY